MEESNIVKAVGGNTLRARVLVRFYDMILRIRVILFVMKREGIASAVRAFSDTRIAKRRLRHADIKKRCETVVVRVKDIKRVGLPSVGYVAAYQRFSEGRQWEETLYWMQVKRDLLARGWTRDPAKYRSWQDFAEELGKWDYVFQSIKEDGFREGKNNIKVTRELVFVDGKHRLAMVDVLGVEEIVVTLVEV
jgi:hypothetical protein